MSASPVFVGSYRNQLTQITPAFGSQPRVVWAPGSNGSRIHSIAVANSGGGNAIQMLIGNALTLQSNMGTGALNKNSPAADTITRTSGSFLADGWQVGQRIVVQGATTVANDVAATISAVTATTITLQPGVFANTENLPAGASLIRALLLGQYNVPGNAGFSTTNPGVSALSSVQIPSIFPAPDNFMVLGPQDLLLAAAGSMLGNGASMDVTVGGGDY